MTNSLPGPRPGLNIRMIDEEVVIVDIESGDVHQLNPTASYIWQLCDGETASEQIVAAMAEHYGISESQARQDVTQVLEDLIKLKLLAPK